MSLVLEESRLRRAARNLDLYVEKSRSRSPDDPCTGRYRLVEGYTNVVVDGATPWPFSLDLTELGRSLGQFAELGSAA